MDICSKIPELTTLCYIECEDMYLMMNRVKKKEDINKGKWIGVGGHFLPGESPDECLIREVKEETGMDLSDFKMRGIVTFIYKDVIEYMHLFTGHFGIEKAAEYDAEGYGCNEGSLKWIPKKESLDLNIWEGDRIFLSKLMETDEFFLLKLIYDDEGILLEYRFGE